MKNMELNNTAPPGLPDFLVKIRLYYLLNDVYL